MLLFDGFSCFVAASAAASWSDFASCPITCRPEPGLRLLGVLSGRVQVSGEGVRGGLVRLRDVTVVAGAENPNRDVAVRRLSCSVTARAAASWSFSADCPIACRPEPPACV